MNLAQMQAIAHDLGCAPELAPLAGGAGAWIFTVRTEETLTDKTAKRAANTELALTTASLLGAGEEPTIMQEFELTAINLTATYEVTPEVEVSTGIIFIARLLIGGDVVWQQSLGGEALPKAASFFSLARFTADFNTPLVLARGRTLQIQLATVVGAATNEVKLALKAQKSTISYYARELTGHRTLG